MTQVEKGAVSLNYVSETPKCFLCDREFTESEKPFELFEKEKHSKSLSDVLSGALGKQLDFNNVHSQLLCDDCLSLVLEYASLEQRYYEIRYKILSTYNITAKYNNFDPIIIEIDGVVEEFDEANNLEQNLFSTDFTSVEALSDDQKFPATELQSQSDNVIIVEDNDSSENDDVTFNSNKNNFVITELCQDLQATDEISVDIMQDIKNQDYSDDEDVQTSLPSPDFIDVVSEDIIYEQIIDSNSQSHNEESDYDENLSPVHDYNGSEATNEISNVTTSIDNNLKYKKSISANQKIDDFSSSLYEFQNGIYYCLLCPNKPEYEPLLFADHMKISHNHQFYICDQCPRSFEKRQDLTNHIDKGHKNLNEKFDCDICERQFSSYRSYRVHKRQHYTVCSKLKQYECRVCNKKYSSINLLQEHMNMHTGKRPFKCDKCPKDFASKYTLQAHAKIHSNRERPYQCDECNKAFFNQQNLLQHKKIHSGIKSFICDICSKAFGTQHNLDVHKIVHSGNKPFICRMCDKAFARRAEIRDHERTHTGERPFVCDICSMAFAQRSNLSTHKKTTHFNDKRHKCTICDRSFKRRRLLEYHTQSTHTGVRPYSCEICTSTFVYPEHFKKHMLIHSGLKPYSCEVCGKKFNSRDNRNAHRFTHSEKKPYECLKCGAGFMRKPLLLAHMKAYKHTNDTIVVNEPQINVPYAISTLKKIELVDDNSKVNNKTTVSIGDAGDDGIELGSEVSYSGEGGDIFVIDSYNESNDHEDEIPHHYIKDELGEVQYLQLTEIEKDGQQALAWVDMEAKD